jgi:fluoride exporter
MRFLYVGVAGALGALSRYGIGLAVGPRSFPWATLGINVSGSFALGALLTVATHRGWAPETVGAVAVGFLGAFTTYSTFAWESFSLARADRVLMAGLYVGASVVLGILAAGVGYAAAEAVQG